MPSPRLPRPATALAFAALVIALTGSAIAAKKYVITSKKQIAPKVLKQLKGKTGPEGAKGDTGAAGAKGDTGATGAAGAKGDTGAAGANGTNGTNGTDGTSGGTTSKQTVADEVTTTSTTEVELTGPSITLNIPAGGANVVIGGSVEAKNSTGGSRSSLIYAYVDSTRVGPGSTFLASTNSTSYATITGASATFVPAGSHTFSLRYQSNNADSTASFQNRTLAVTVLG